ncbi:MAG: ABC transporter ATP-binding protein [Chloroflexaceae bacterium]|jgi:peptide/nickel transport system ATP-binding protein|nr:ABC transporter ATP-binding protein [Chloroflexaceae bacterium]
MTDEHFISAAGLVKIYRVADLEVVALQGLDLEVARGEFLALVGPSGSGKSTLLSALGGLDRPSAGRLAVDGVDLLKLSPTELTTYRREQVGFVWQQTTRNLLPYLSARQNIELLMTLAGQSARERREWANELLEAVGMSDYAHQRPPQLSGGQQQRIAIACALANKPKILLGDEPTGEVDWATAQMILKLLRDLRSRYGLTLVVVTHDPRVAAEADRVIMIRDGQTSSERLQVGSEQPAVGSLQAGVHGTVGDSHTASEELPTANRQLPTKELVVLDRAGRLQLPADQRELVGIGRRARIEIVDGGILIRPADDGAERAAQNGDSSPEEHATDPNGMNGNEMQLLETVERLYSDQPLKSVNGDKPTRGRRWGLKRKA